MCVWYMCRFVCLCVHVESGGGCWVSCCITSYLIPLRRLLSWAWSSCQPGNPNYPPVPSLLSPGVKVHVRYVRLFTQVLGFKLRPLYLGSEHFNHGAIFQSALPGPLYPCLGMKPWEGTRVFSSLLFPKSVYFEDEVPMPANVAMLSHTASVDGNQHQWASGG